MKFKFFLIVLFISAGCAFAQQKDYIEKKRKEALKEIESTQTILNEVSKSKTSSVERLKLLEKQISSRTNLLSNLSTEIESKDKEITEQQILISAIENDVKSIRELYSRLIFIAYKKHRKGNYFIYILSSNNFGQAYKRLMYIKQYSYFRKKQLATIEEIRTNLSLRKRELEISKVTKQGLLKEKEREIVKLDSEKKNQNEEFKQLQKREGQLKRNLAEKVKIANKLQREIEAIIKSELARKKTEVPKAREENRVISGNFKENRGRLPWPTDKGIIINPFGEQNHPVLKGVVTQNNGVDISTQSNAKVYSVFEGEVKRVFSFLGANYTVIVRHGEYLTLYQNLSNVSVKVGERIKARQEIGSLFTESNSRTSVLHLEIWEESNKLNPEIWLSKN
jgi:septal ring factor EnvC (AmiA/AmiB activator)